jgi:hypothetical protein
MPCPVPPRTQRRGPPKPQPRFAADEGFEHGPAGDALGVGHRPAGWPTPTLHERLLPARQCEGRSSHPPGRSHPRHHHLYPSRQHRSGPGPRRVPQGRVGAHAPPRTQEPELGQPVQHHLFPAVFDQAFAEAGQDGEMEAFVLQMTQPKPRASGFDRARGTARRALPAGDDAAGLGRREPRAGHRPVRESSGSMTRCRL